MQQRDGHVGTQTRPTAAVVISAYTLDRWPDLEAGLAGLANQTLPPTEVMVVVDNNAELSARARRVGAHLLPQLVVTDFQGGLSAARNLGAKLSKSEILAFLDDDACPGPAWLSELVQPFAEDETVMMTGGAILPGWPSTGRPLWFPDEFLWVVGATYRGAHSRSDLRNPLGASMAVRRIAWEAIGGFATSIGLGAETVAGCEETDFAVRLKATDDKYRYIYCGDSEVSHRVTAERRTFRYFLHRCKIEGRSKAYFLKRNGAASIGPERVHAFSTIPLAIAKNFVAFLRGDRHGLSRIGALMIGLLVVGVNFCIESVRLSAQRRQITGQWES